MEFGAAEPVVSNGLQRHPCDGNFDGEKVEMMHAPCQAKLSLDTVVRACAARGENRSAVKWEDVCTDGMPFSRFYRLLATDFRMK